jgi:toxin ParE1/3/4
VSAGATLKPRSTRVKSSVRSHALYYRIADVDVIEVVRILHHRMDVDRHFD